LLQKGFNLIFPLWLTTRNVESLFSDNKTRNESPIKRSADRKKYKKIKIYIRFRGIFDISLNPFSVTTY